MDPQSVVQLLERAVEGRRLLDHPFYRRWESGDLKAGELAGYAGQYRHFEQHLPVALAGVSELLPEGRARSLVEANLADELDGTLTHLELFDHFAAEVDSSADPAGPAVTELIATYDRARALGAGAGLAAIAAYEIQAGAVAVTKSIGLRVHYGVSESGRSFWDAHGELEVDHARWTVEALSNLGDAEVLFATARDSADAWWAFLDEREAFASTL